MCCIYIILLQTSQRMLPSLLSPVTRPHSLQDVSNGYRLDHNIQDDLTHAPKMTLPIRPKTPTSSSTSTKRCHHSWGPCPKDFSYHSSRSSSVDRSRRRSGSPWGWSSSSSSTSSPVVRKMRLRKHNMAEKDERSER